MKKRGEMYVTKGVRGWYGSVVESPGPTGGMTSFGPFPTKHAAEAKAMQYRTTMSNLPSDHQEEQSQQPVEGGRRKAQADIRRALGV